MLVSVIIAAFDAELFIEQALDSACRQTPRPIEVIVCDDGSKDRTPEIVRGYMQRYSFIKLLENKENRGVSYSRNRAISIATGDWLAILDADDFFRADRLETLLLLAETHSVDILFDNLMYVSQIGQTHGPALKRRAKNKTIFLSPPEFVAKNRGTGFSYGYLQLFVRRSLVHEHAIAYRENIRYQEDFPFTLECLMKARLALITMDPMYYYRILPDSLSRRPVSDRYQGMLSVNDHFVREALSSGDTLLVDELKKREIFIKKRLTVQCFVNNMKTREYAQAFHLFAHNIKYLMAFLRAIWLGVFVRLKERLRV